MNDVERPEILLQSRSGWIPVDWRELYATRELFLTMIGRDVRVRYKQTVLGVGWAIIQPLATMVIFSAVFGRFLPNVDTQGVPYPLFVYAGLVPWTFFSTAVNAAGTSVIAQAHLMSKIYFPRVYAPASSIGVALFDMLVAFSLFLLLMPFYRTSPSWQVAFVPVLILLTFMATVGIGLTTASLIILFRDFRYILNFGLQTLLYLTPVIFPTAYFKGYAPLLAINPMFGLIDAFRSAIFGTPWNPTLLAISTATTFASLVFGVYFFRRVERHIADYT